MKLKLLLSAVFLSLASVTGCGSNGTSNPPAPAVLQSTTDIGTLPCKSLKSGYLGDGLCIEAPDPSAGFQFHYGPSNYADATEVAKYVLMPGQEVTDCVFLKTPNTSTVYFNAYHSRMRPGSHHMLLYLQTASVTETGSSGPSNCNQGLQSRNLFGAQTAKLDAATAYGPENDGLAVQIAASQQAVLQAHFINATSQPILREVWANVMYVDKSRVTQVGDPIFFLGGLGMSISAGQTKVLHGTAAVPTNAAPDFRLILATGHYHAHTSEFAAWATIDGQKVSLFNEYNSVGTPPEPKNWNFDSIQQNMAPDPATRTSGAAYSGVLHLKPGDKIDWECTVTNDGKGTNGAPNTSPLTFGNYVFTAEMCNMFGLYAPSIGGAWRATNF